jgi:hypothetical protein
LVFGKVYHTSICLNALVSFILKKSFFTFQSTYMRKILSLIVISCLLLFGANRAAAQESFKWAEMNTFHSTAMLSFHGAEDGKLQPTRDSATTMVTKATVWQSSKMPSGVNESAVKPLLQKLVDECKAVQQAVAAKKSDADLKPLVLKAHHTFHEIIEKTK